MEEAERMSRGGGVEDGGMRIIFLAFCFGFPFYVPYGGVLIIIRLDALSLFLQVTLENDGVVTISGFFLVHAKRNNG